MNYQGQKVSFMDLMITNDSLVMNFSFESIYIKINLQKKIKNRNKYMIKVFL